MYVFGSGRVGDVGVSGLGLPIMEEQAEIGICVCDLVAVVWVVLGSAWAAWVRESGVKSVFVVSLDYFC